MAKKGKQNKKGSAKGKKGSPKQEEPTPTSRITMKDLEEMSVDGEMPPEEEWDADAKTLKEMIMGGQFDHLLDKDDGSDDDVSIEEVELDGKFEEEADDNDRKKKRSKKAKDSEKPKEEESEQEADDSPESERDSDKLKQQAQDESEEEAGSDAEEEEKESDAEEEEEEKEEVEQTVEEQSIAQKNQYNSKALHVTTRELIAEKQSWAWAETYQLVPPTPLPFEEGKAASLDIHDDLKREVAFYDMALEAVHIGRSECTEAEIPFTRPEDFFVEMVKTDDHMARVKDRLIFETKKMEAVSQRRSNKEFKLRAKESQQNKIAEKAKRKKDHFQEVEEWAESAKANRGQDDAGGKKGNNRDRQYADKKFGFGGKKGRFKQNDHTTKNDMSGYNPNGNFPGGMKHNAKTHAAAGGGGKRKGKRARDASKTRR